MRKFVVTLMASLLSCSAATAFWPEAAESSLGVGIGYRQDKLEWGIPARRQFVSYDNDVPPLGTHVKWHDLNIWQIEAAGKYVTCDNVYLRANVDYGWVTSGKRKSKDHFQVIEGSFYPVSDDYSYGYGDDYYGYGYDYGYGYNYGYGYGYPSYYEEVGYGQIDDFSVVNRRHHAKGHVYDAKLAVGYQFRMCDDTFTVSPLIGYSWHGQHLHDHDKHHHSGYYSSASYYDDYSYSYYDDYYYNNYSSYNYYNNYYDYSDYYSDYNYSYSSYSSGHKDHNHLNTRWNGPFIGVDFDYAFGCCSEWRFFGTYEFHWAEYHAHSNWSLHHGFHQSWQQHSKHAYGNVLDVGIEWDFCDSWMVALKGEFQWWWAHHGRIHARQENSNHFGEFSQHCVVSAPLHHVKWDSAAISLNLKTAF